MLRVNSFGCSNYAIFFSQTGSIAKQQANRQNTELKKKHQKTSKVLYFKKEL